MSGRLQTVVPGQAGTLVPPADEMARVADARHHDPGTMLGRHMSGATAVARSLLPGAERATVRDTGGAMSRIGNGDIFQWAGPEAALPECFQVTWWDRYGAAHTAYDPYCFPPGISDFDLHLFSEGTHRYVYRILGAHVRRVQNVEGVCFATWAPNAVRVSVVGDFNGWDPRWHAMRSRGASGVWELFIPGVKPGCLYKFDILTRDGRSLVKTDPYARLCERRPATAGVVTESSAFPWSDSDWLSRRAARDWQHAPMSIYELHLGSWRRGASGEFLSYRELAAQLVPYILELGFTHIELLPVTEHPLDASWGYQTTGFFAPTSRFGAPDDFRYFVDHCHAHGIGVILDWVAGHFPRDGHALMQYDGTALYEHEDPRRGEHPDWGTLIFNYGRNEVRAFLVSNAIYWLEEFHVDGLRVDAVAAMLYLDYSRKEGEWLPNRFGGRENLEAIQFLKELNQEVLSRNPGAIMTAEESTAWPLVTRPPWVGGLGFTMKWNMGWMHDTLAYMTRDPVYRQYYHDHLTFGMLYNFHENFVLPFSHDEVVHGKGSLLNKMPGDNWQRFASLRLLYTYQFTYPGKKLQFMGAELAGWREWDHDRELDWHLAGEPWHQGIRRLVSDLNRLYVTRPSLHHFEFEQQGFEWLDCHDSSQSVLCYLRRRGDDYVVVVLNFTPVPRRGYRVGVPRAGFHAELFNSDSAAYSGTNMGNEGGVTSVAEPWMGRPCSLRLDLPPLGALILDCPP